MMKTQTPLERAISAALSLRFVPSEYAERVKIGEILIDLCSGKKQFEIATRVIYRELSEWPGPADFRRLISAALKAAGQLPPGCDRCLGSDHVIVLINRSSAAGRCACERGQVLTQLDTERRSLQRLG